MNQPKRQLKINMIELEGAFEHNDPTMEISYFLDLETGEVVMTMGETRRLREEVYEEYADPGTGELDWTTVLPQLDIQDWEKDVLIEADQVEKGFGTRYIAIPQIESHEGYEDMVDFIDTVTNPQLQARLERAINGRGPFRHFKDVLLNYPKDRERWFSFKNDRMHQRVLDWLEEEGIEPI